VDHHDSEGQRWWQRLLMPALLTVIVAQSALLAWMWWNRPAAAAPLVMESVAVTSEPAGASVIINGVERGKTPITFEDVPPEGKWSIHVNQDAAPIATPLASTAGTLAITTEPAGLTVTVDNQPRGPSPVTVTGLAPGAHDVIVTRGAAVHRRTVSVEPGVRTALLVSTAGAGISSGWLTIAAPVPVDVTENGVLLGRSDTPRLLLPVGRHDLEFANATFQYRDRQTVQILAGQTANVALGAANGSLSVNAQPWGEVWVDGRLLGETPLGNVPLPIGAHDLIVRHPQLGEQHRRIMIGVEVPTRIGVDLRKQ
jgi:serine/threonine-protein kinase